jgi:hypothetical protein
MEACRAKMGASIMNNLNREYNDRDKKRLAAAE